MEIIEVCRLNVGDLIRDLRQNDVLNTRRCVPVTRVDHLDRGRKRKGSYVIEVKTGPNDGLGYLLNARHKVIRVRSLF